MNGDRRSRGARSGAIVAGTWLIGLGLVFLIRDLAELSWTEAWPMFLIVVGAGSLASSLVGRRGPAGAWSLVWPLAWMAVGAVFLLGTTGSIDLSPGELVSRWWPVALVAIGIWFLVASVWAGRSRPTETLALPLAGATAGEVRLKFGAGRLGVSRGVPGSLVSGTFRGGVVYQARGPGSVDLEPDQGGGWPIWGETLEWDVGLSGEVPLDLRVESGANRSHLDLTELLVRRLELKTGASETHVVLPRAAGATWVRAEAGVASLTIEVPGGVAAQIRARMTLGNVHVDESRFQRTFDGWASPDIAFAPNRVDIEVTGGMGSLRVI